MQKCGSKAIPEESLKNESSLEPLKVALRKIQYIYSKSGSKAKKSNKRNCDTSPKFLISAILDEKRAERAHFGRKTGEKTNFKKF